MIKFWQMLIFFFFIVKGSRICNYTSPFTLSLFSCHDPGKFLIVSLFHDVDTFEDCGNVAQVWLV